MENLDTGVATNEEALVVELGVAYLETGQRRRLNEPGARDYRNEHYKGYVYQTKTCTLKPGGVMIKTSKCKASRDNTGCAATIKVFISEDGH